MDRNDDENQATPVTRGSPEGLGESFKRIARNALSILLGSAAGEVLTGYAIVLAAVTLGPEAFGTMSSAQALNEPFDMLAGFGLSQVVITVAASRGGSDGTLRGTTLFLREIFGLLAVFLVVMLAAATNRTNMIPMLLILGVGTMITQATAVVMMPFEYEQTMHRTVVVPFFVSVVRLSLAYVAVWFLPTPVGFLCSGLAAGVASFVLNGWVSRRYYPVQLRFDWQLAKELLSASWPVAVLQFVSVSYMRGSYFLLHESGPLVQGEYAAADRLVRPLLTIGGVFFYSSLPTIARLASSGEFKTLSSVYWRAVVRIVGFSLIPLGVVWVVAPWLLQRFVPAYAGATGPFRLLAVGTVFMFLNQMSSVFVFAVGRQRLIMVVAMINFVVYFSLAVHLIPRYQATGAALATAVMEGANTVMQLALVGWLLHRETRRVATTQDGDSKST